MTRFGIDKLKTCIEIPVCCALFSMFVQNSIYTNLVLYRTCYINLGYNESDCALLGTGIKNNFTNELTKLVEPTANTIILLLQLPVGIICAIIGLFVGSWSDRNGRKPILIATTAAQSIAFGITSIYCLLPGLSLWYLLFACIPVLFTGGFAAMLTTFLSYITDVSDEYNRGLRLGIFEVCFSVTSLTGTLSSSFIFDRIGYVGVYLVSTIFTVVAFLFIIFVMEESLPEAHRQACQQENGPSYGEQLKDMTRTAFKERPQYGRPLIILCIIITSLFIFAIMSDIGIIYLFLQLKFNWSLEKFTIFSSIRDFLSILGTFAGIYGLHKVLGVNETLLVMVGLISSFSSSLVQGLANADIHIYLAGTLRFLSGCVNPMIRSLISKIAKPDEIGKIFSVAVMCQSILQLVGSPMYTELYNKSLSFWPSLYNFLTAAIFFVALILSIVVIILRFKASKDITFDVLDEDVAPLPGSINDGLNEDA